MQIHPRDLLSASDLDRLPLIDKETLRADPARFVSESGKGR